MLVVRRLCLGTLKGILESNSEQSILLFNNLYINLMSILKRLISRDSILNSEVNIGTDVFIYPELYPSKRINLFFIFLIFQFDPIDRDSKLRNRIQQLNELT